MDSEVTQRLITVLDAWVERGFLTEDQNIQLQEELAKLYQEKAWSNTDEEIVAGFVEDNAQTMYQFGVPQDSLDKLGVWVQAEISVSEADYGDDALSLFQGLVEDIGEDLEEGAGWLTRNSGWFIGGGLLVGGLLLMRRR